MRDGLLDVLGVGDAPGEADRERHADADLGAVLGVKVPMKVFFGRQRGEAGVLGGLAALGVLGDRVHRVLGGGGQVRGRRPGGAVPGYLPVDRVALGVLDHDVGQLALGRGRPSARRWCRRTWRRPSARWSTTAWDCLASAVPRPCPSPSPAPASRSAAPAARGDAPAAAPRPAPPAPYARASRRSPRVNRRPRYRPHVQVFLPSRAWSGPHPGAFPRAPAHINHTVRASAPRECHRSVPTRQIRRWSGTHPPVRSLHARCPPSTPSSPCSIRRGRCRGDRLVLAVDDLDDVPDQAAVEEPARRGVRSRRP